MYEKPRHSDVCLLIYVLCRDCRTGPSRAFYRSLHSYFNGDQMKCYNHQDRDAVATCSECGVGLCKECADKHNPILCDRCFEKACQEVEAEYRYDLESDIKGFYLTALIGIALVWIFYALRNNGLPMNAVEFMGLFFVPYAFRGIRRYLPGGGCLLMVVKFVVGWFLGIVFFGWQLVRTGRAIRLNEIENKKGISKEVSFVVSNLIIALVVFLVIKSKL